MIGPTWLATTLGLALIVASMAALIRILVAARTLRATDFEVDAHNVVMGISMAGMLIPPLLIVTPGPSTTVWIAVWILITFWFGASVIRGVARSQGGLRFRGHHLPHLVMSAAMVYMLVAQGSGHWMGQGKTVAGMSGMSTSAGLVALPTVDYAFAIFMVGYAVLVIDRLPVIAIVGTGDLRILGHRESAGRPVALAPRLAAVTNIVMAVTMAYMLAMMFV